MRAQTSSSCSSRWRLAAACGCFILLPLAALAQFGGMPGMGMPEPPKAHAVKSDVQYIKCQACEAFVKQAYRHTKATREGLRPGKKLAESDIIETLESMCDPSKPQGQWITHIDIVEQGTELKLVDTGSPSKCEVECMTVARACSQVADEIDLSDLSESLFKGKKRAALSAEACHESSGVCRKKPPPVPKSRKPGPPHTPMTPEEVEREKMMASMKAAGLGGQMFSRDDVMGQLQGMEGMEGMMGGGMEGLVGGGDESGGGEASEEEGLRAHVAKARETVQEVVGQAKEAAGAVVDKASSFLKQSLGGLLSKGGGDGGEL